MDLAGQKGHSLSRGVATEGDEIVRRAILLHTGKDVVMTDVARLGRVARFNDGTVVFSYGGIDLIRLWPMQVKTIHENGLTVMKASQQYEMLI